MTDLSHRAIPVAYNASGRLFGLEEEQEVLEVVRSGTLTRWGGAKVDALEMAWAAKLGTRHAVAVSSGTASIHVALAALDLEPGSEVITSPVTDMGTVIAIIAAGLVPVFADVDPTTGMLAPDSVESRIGPNTTAILAVHLFGRFAPIQQLATTAGKHGLALIEDASQAHFTTLSGTPAGTIGAVGCFSLQQTKVVSCGEGGIAVTNDDALADRMRLYQNKGWIRGASDERAYPFVGLNYRMPELSAAIAGAQLRRADEIIARRHRTMTLVLDLTSRTPGLCTPTISSGEHVSWWALLAQYPGLGDIHSARATVAALNRVGLPVALGYVGPFPLYMMDSLQHKKTQGTARLPWCLTTPEVHYRAGDCPAAEWFMSHSVTMNWNECISDDDAHHIAAALIHGVPSRPTI